MTDRKTLVNIFSVLSATGLLLVISGVFIFRDTVHRVESIVYFIITGIMTLCFIITFIYNLIMQRRENAIYDTIESRNQILQNQILQNQIL